MRAAFQSRLNDALAHKLDWFEKVDIRSTATGAWDEPPKFSGLTNAYFQVLERGKDALTVPFKR
jgi:hypothetical protein